MFQKYETGKNWEAEHVSSPFVSPSCCSSYTSSPTNNPARVYSEVPQKKMNEDFYMTMRLLFLFWAKDPNLDIFGN